MSMTTTDPDVFAALVGRAVTDLGAVPAAGLMTLGRRLGLFRALADGGPQSTHELAGRTETAERYVREWARGLAAGGYVTYSADDDTYSLSPEQQMVLLPGGPVDVPTAASMWLSAMDDVDAIERAFRSGGGLGWHEHNPEIWYGTDAFYRAGYEASLVSDWLPALDGVVARLEAGGRVADVGTGLGTALRLIAEAFPSTEAVGFDYHQESIEAARQSAEREGSRARFEVADASSFPGGDYDLVTSLDALHDLGDPVAAARRVYDALSSDGAWMVVEPAAGGSVQENLNPVGRLFYAASTFLCVPHARSQGGEGLGAQAGEDGIRAVAREAGFTRVRLAAQTPFNHVYEIRR